jgi:hypothetical protein
MAQLDAATIRDIEKAVIERLASVGHIMVIDQIALALGLKARDLADLPNRCPAYGRLIALKPKYIARLASEIPARPGKFSTLEACADYAEILAVEDELNELTQQLRGPNGDGPNVA